MPARRLLPLALVALALALPACDALDPTRVDNPQTTDDDLASSRNPTRALLPGLRAQFARALGAVVITTEAVSDNYSIQNSGLSQTLDRPRDLAPDDATLGTTGGSGAYWNLQELRALCDFILNDIVPRDPAATPAERAEAHYYRGMAYLMQGENFVAVPTERDGLPRPAPELLTRAVTDLSASLTLQGSGSRAQAARAALARAHRALGNAAEAATHAEAALASGATFVFAQAYDPGVTSVNNPPHSFLVARSLQEFQPLPRLDFLDPKYLTLDAAIPVAKAEEMHLILAEVALAQGDNAAARERMALAAQLARSGGTARPTVSFEDQDVRSGQEGIRPRDAVIRVRADADSPYRTGLVLQRPGPVSVPTVSSTSFTADSVRAVPVDDAAHLRRLLYTLRQEILFLEGRRMHDLGIRLPMMLREISTNPNITAGDRGTRVVVPAWIPPEDEMDRFTPMSPYDNRERLITQFITIRHDMNRVLADARGLVLQQPMPGL